MSLPAPPVDRRSADDVARQLEALIALYAPEWRERDPATGYARGYSAGLIGVFARFTELVIQRLNQAPGKNQLAFLDMLGATPTPPQPARAPLTFRLADGARGAVVPARTQVAASPPPGSRSPLLFETVQPLHPTPATLRRIVSWDGPADRMGGTGADSPLFRGDGPVSHAFHISHDAFFGTLLIHGLRLDITLATPLPDDADPREIVWEVVDQAGVRPLVLRPGDGESSDRTANLTRSGSIDFQGFGQVGELDLGGVKGRWVRARLVSPLTDSTSPVAGRLRRSQLPIVSSILINALVGSGALKPDHAIGGGQVLDTTRDFFPFGERPATGAVFYLASESVFSQTNRLIYLSFTRTPAGSGLTYGAYGRDLVIAWEYFTEAGWLELGRGSPLTSLGDDPESFRDYTLGFVDSGAVHFVLQTPPARTTVGGVESYWVRARIVAGWYGTPATSNMVGPCFAAIDVSFTNELSWARISAPEKVMLDDGMRLRLAPPSFTAFDPAEDRGSSLYVGFALPSGMMELAQTPVSLFADLADLPFGTTPDDATPGPRPELDWRIWNGTTWAPVAMEDGTEGLTLSGPLRFLPPRDMAPAALFGSPPMLWLRAAWTHGAYKFLPRLRRLLLNTVMGEQAVTVAAEVLGSGTGEPGQRLRAAQTPILAGVRLEVFEPELPSAAERARLTAEEGDDAVASEAQGGMRVRWHQVADFHASGPRDRHYILDHVTGEIRFGDGQSGLIPPRGAGNIRLMAYRTGGGAAGNVPAGAISQMKTTVPFIDGATNPLPATGGVMAESLTALRDRAPRMVRHGGRAVTAEDFEDLTRMASAEVARCRAVPLIDLSIDPGGSRPVPGRVSVIVVPKAEGPRPSPSVGLTDLVTDALAASALPGIGIVVVGPEYVRVDVRVTAALAGLDGAGIVAGAIAAALDRYLHPLTGGPDGLGWEFGRTPRRSDVTALLQAVPGVDHLRRLEIALVADRPGGEATGRFLLCAGQHDIDLVFGS